MEIISEIKNISIKDYLNGIGIETRKEGNRYFASSPFSTDTNWSFCIYPTNTYFDWANGHGGSIIDLYSKINNVSTGEAIKALKEGIKYETYKPNYKKIETAEQWRSSGPFDYKKYINTNPEECEKIKAYAASRGIKEGYFCGVFFIRSGESVVGEKWIRIPALGFLHTDKDLKPCGVKLRRIDGKEPRFSARGRLHHYLLLPSNTETQQSKLTQNLDNVLYVVEGEANANSLWEFLGRTSPVLSFGGVSSTLTRGELPLSLCDYEIRLILDYDGNEKLYQERLKLYKGLPATPVRMILPKGEDINLLYNQNKMWMIEHLLLT